MILLSPWLLLLALLVPAALWRRRGGPSVAFAPAMLLRVPRSWRVRLLSLPRALQALALLLLIVALARPARREPLPLRAEGIDILLCLDTSSSMTARDMDRQRTRLDVAKAAAAEFVRGRPEDRIGLLSFARYPDLRCPLTLDHEALLGILDRVTTVSSDGPEDATGLGTAVARAAQVLSGDDRRERVAILLTDGDENVAVEGAAGEIAPSHAAQLCAALGARVYAVSVGVRGPRVDTGALKGMATRTGGEFHEARDAGAVAAVYRQIDALEKTGIEKPRYVIEDRFLPFLLLGILLMLAARVLDATVLQVFP
ncbi:MAG TPA: VWA domain-containing protein [Planctomycetota bacterium]|nr:VWA domain-containing protein [Planctomycetota bacterium]